MILARQVFQVKFGHMDEVLAAIRKLAESGRDSGSVSRVLTDLSGPNFTLVFETVAESMDAYWKALQADFADPQMGELAGAFNEYIESGHREFYTIEYGADQ